MSGMEEFKDLYIQTARERLQALSDLLLKLEKNPQDTSLIEELMRTGHSLKGESAAMGYEKIATLAHVIEDLFTGIGSGSLTITTPVMDELFGSLDQIGACIDSIAATNTEVDLSDIITRIKDLTGLKTEGFGKTDKSQPVVAGSTPTQTSSAPTTENSSTEQPANTATTPPNPTTTSPATAKPAQQQITTVNLKIEKLDQMISISEELVLLKMKLKTNSLVQSNSDLKAEIHRLDRLVTDMQFHIMQARLFPISLALHTLPRLVRDTAKKTGKQVRLELVGEDTTVDRTIIDHLTEPFVHMIRNAIDHGIEAPEMRTKVGKPAEAVVTVTAYTKENKFYVEVSDDGQGIEWDKVVKAAVKKGFITQEAAAGLSEKQTKELLFIGGVSTNEVVTDVSGRGVGMAAVYQAIKKLGGTLDIKTEVGKGTTFTFRLPMTLAIMQALLVNVAGQTYAMPSNEIVRSIQIDPQHVTSTAGKAAVVVDGEDVILYDLASIFHLGEARSAHQLKQSEAKHTVVLVRLGHMMIGCMVNKIVAEEEILVKPLGTLLKQSTLFSGATILANGAAAPIINLEGLLA